jgi:tetratricopeptide (TPR) repeat protein
MRRALVSWLLLTMPTIICAQDDNGPPEEFRRAYALAEKKQFDDALRIFDEALKEGRHTRNALFSAGSISMCAGQFERAQKYFTLLRELEPRSGRTRAALVRTAQALGDMAARDAERSELFRLRESREDPEIVQQDYFIRDEFRVADRQVRALEFFELKGERALRYAFEISRRNSPETDFRVSLGSYAVTNAIWQATQKPKPKIGDRLFHLDGYFANGSHTTFRMHHPEPSYDEVRKLVVAIVQGRTEH